MAALHDVRRCAAGCCFFVGRHPVSEDNYKKAMLEILPSPDVRMSQTTVPCMNFLPNKRRAEKAGFYLGWAAINFQPTGDYYMYDSETNDFMRNANEADIRNWETFRA